MRRSSSWMLAALLGLSVMPVKPAHGTEPTFSEATDVVVVEVPVQVIRDGEPVRGLTADDFEVFEGRKKLPVTGFEVLDLNAVQARPGESWKPAQGISARRHFLLLFDMGSASPKTVAHARLAALDLLEGLHPSDLAGVATYRPSKGPELLLGFTTDREQARAALDRLGKPEMLDRAADPLRLVLNAPAWSGEAGGGGGGRGGSGGGGGGGPRGGDRREALEAALGSGDTPFTSTVSVPMAQAERAVRQRAVAAMSRGYADLAKAMGGLYGRKYVILFSEGFDSALFQGTANVDEQNTMASASTIGAVWGVDSERRFGSAKTTNDLEKMLEEFRRGDCVIQTVDIGGLRERGGMEEQWVGSRDSLFLMADATGGELYENFNDLSAAMDQMLKRASVTYVLAFQPEGLKKDGGYHRLRVELKNAPRGTRLVHRPGYYAPRPFQERSPTERLMQTAQQVLSGRESGGIPLDVLVAPFQLAADGPSYVPVVIEADGPALVSGLAGQPLPAEIYVYAMDAAGAVRGFFSQTVALDLAKVGPALRQSGLKFFGHLDLGPGQYSVRVLVRNGITGAAGMKVASLQVPAFSAAEPVLLPAFFPEEPGRWLIVREAGREGDRSVPYPFMAGDEPFIPSSRPAVAPDQEATVALVGYHLRNGELRAEARVLTADGREAGPAELRVVRRSGGGEGADQVQAALRTPGLQPGEYLLVITLTDPAGGSESSITPFVVKG
jgi:VWFA-related protein